MKSTDFIVEAGALPIYYFAYGMLTDPQIMKGVDFIGVATLNNFKFELLEFANVYPKAGNKVLGCLWAIDRRLLSQLDKVEGYPQLYDRKTVPVFCDGKRYEAELYTMTPETRKKLRGTWPKVSYTRKILRGYMKAGIPVRQINVKHL